MVKALYDNHITIDGTTDISCTDDAAERFEAAGVEAIAVCFLHAFTNPAHEQQAGAWLRTRFPDLAISLSCEVAPEIRERIRATLGDGPLTISRGAYVGIGAT